MWMSAYEGMTAMPDLFDQLAPKLLSVEGGYSNDPKDPGGETNHGVTVAVARAHGFTGSMRNLTKAQALDIYRRAYWSSPRFDQVASRSPRVAEELFDTGVNMGVGVAGRFLQRCLNALNREAADYPDLVVDGALGPASMHALDAYLRVRGKDGETVLYRMLNALQGARYVEIVEGRPSSERFAFGWFLHRVS